MRTVANAVKELLPDGLGFAVLVFEFEGGPAGYISNAQRAEMIKALREQADVLEAHLDIRTPEEN